MAALHAKAAATPTLKIANDVDVFLKCSRLLGGSVSMPIGTNFAFAPRKLPAAPVPQRRDFFGRPAAASIFGDAEAGGNSILKIHARGQHRLGQYAKAVELLGPLACAAAASACAAPAP